MKYNSTVLKELSARQDCYSYSKPVQPSTSFNQIRKAAVDNANATRQMVRKHELRRDQESKIKIKDLELAQNRLSRRTISKHK